MIPLLAHLRALKPGVALLGSSLLVLLLLLVAVWTTYQSASQEAAGQDKSGKTATSAKAEEIPPITVPEINIPAPFTEPPKKVSADRSSHAIPGLGDMDVIGFLQYFPSSDFRCPGASPDRGLSKRTCKSSSKDDPPVVLEVTLVEDNPITVRSVTASAYNATDDAAADFFRYVIGLSLEDTDPINPQTWVKGSISSGGKYPAEGAELKLYGTEGGRTLEIVGSAPP